MTTTTSDLPALREELAELKAARRKILTGKATVNTMWSLGGNHSVTKQQASISDINARITQIEDEIAGVEGSGRHALHWS